MSQNAPWPSRHTISIITDPPGWFTPFTNDLADRLTAAGHIAQVFDQQKDVLEGSIAFYLSCTGITPKALLARNPWNIVLHASPLPKGRGFSPLVWQILEGINTIPLTMITMAEDVDAGDIVAQRKLQFKGYELNDEMREVMGKAIVDMCFDMAIADAAPDTKPQSGSPSWYRRRGPADSALDPNQSLASQFNLLRVVDNDRYPAFFDHAGHRYTLTITRQPLKDSDL